MTDEPRRLLATSDLHYSLYRTGDACTRELARRVCDSDADAFLIAGDIAGADPQTFDDCLALFEGFGGAKMLVPGNHDVWVKEGSSRTKYEQTLPRLAARHGFRVLDQAPLVLGSLGFIGSIGWYDYSMRDASLELPASQYRRKVLPGVATWNDLVYVKWEWSDTEFLDLCIERLVEHYRRIESRVERIVALLHHLPFEELAFESEKAAFAFARAYMGSDRMGRALERMPKLELAICGHRHGHAQCKRDRIRAFVAGSEYRLKRLLWIDLTEGRVDYEDIATDPSAEGIADKE